VPQIVKTEIFDPRHLEYRLEAPLHALPLSLGAPLPSTANLTYSSFDDLVNDIPNAGEVNLGLREFDLRANTLGFFLQDDLKVNRRLVVNMGVRWDYFSVPKERDKRLFNRAQPFGTGPYTDPDAIWEPDYNNFSPRLGFAYQLRSNGKSVLRGGGGMFHSPIPLYAGPVDLVRDAVDGVLNDSGEVRLACTCI
jgi:hypothetical protein